MRSMTQLELNWRSWGGPREGSGRKRQQGRVEHEARARTTRHVPLMVTCRLVRGLPSLRQRQVLRVLRLAFAEGRERFGMRLCVWSLQDDHIHLIVEAEDATALTRGMKGLAVRSARTLNRLWNRKGRVFDERFHMRQLRTPRQV